MKKILVIALAVVAMVFSASAQSDKKAQREALLAAQIEALGDYIEIDDAQKDAFNTLYREYYVAVRKSQTKAVKVPKEEMTEEIVLQNLNIYLDNIIAKAEVRKNYAQKFSELVGAKKATKFFKGEDKVAAKVKKEMAKK